MSLESPSEKNCAVNADLYPPHARVKSCGQCGVAFLCGPQEDNGDCWCDRLPNIMPLLSSAHACLCKACLQQAIEQRIAATPISTTNGPAHHD